MKDFVNQSKWSVILTVARVGVGFVVSILTARTLGADGRGQYAFALLMMGTVSLFLNPGLYASANFYVSSHQMNKSEAFQTAFSLSVPFAIFSAVVAVALYWVIIILRGGVPDSTILAFAVLVGVGASAMMVGSTMSGLLFGTGQVKAVALVAFVSATLQLLIAITYALIARSYSPVFYVALFVGAQFFEMIARTVLAGRGAWKRPSFQSQNYKRFLNYGLPVHLGRVLLVGSQRIDAYLVFILAGQAALGLYSISSMVAEQLWLLPTAVSMVMMTNIAYRTTEDAGRVTSTASKTVTLLALVCAAVLAVLGTWLIPILFGDEFSASIVPFLIMLPGMVAICIYPVLEPFFQSRMKPWIPVRITGISALANGMLCLLLIPRLGIVGAAVAYSLSYLMQAGLAIVAFGKVTHRPVSEPINILMPIGFLYRAIESRVAVAMGRTATDSRK